MPLNSPEVSKTEILGEESPSSDGFEVSKTTVLEGESLGGGSHRAKNGPHSISTAEIIVMGDESESFDDLESSVKIVSGEGNQSLDDLLQGSPEHKRQRKTPLVVGSCENGPHITRCANAIVLGGESKSLHDSQASQSQEGNQIANNFVHLSPQHKLQSKMPLVVGRARNVPSITQGANVTYFFAIVDFYSYYKYTRISFSYDLHVMPGLRRQTDEPLVSSTSTDPSKDAHSPYQSLTSTETTDSTKLIEPKNSVSEFYDTPVYDPLIARRSKLPKQISKSLRVVAPCPW